MTDILIYICFVGATLAGFVLGVLTCAYFTAPEGYQTKDGFKYGEGQDEEEK